MFSVIHNKSILKSFSIFLIIVFIIGFLPQPAVRADSINQVDSPPTQLEVLEGNQIDLVTTTGKLATFELHVKSPQNGAFFVWKLAEPAVNGSVNISDTNSQATITYMPDSAFSGLDRFAIRVNDMQGNAYQIVFHVLVENDPEPLDLKEPLNPKHEAGATINQLNGGIENNPMGLDRQFLEPVADRSILRIAQGESLTIQLDGETEKRVTLNAIGVNPAGLTWRVTQRPIQGEVFLNPSGNSVEVVYKPAEDFREIDTLKLAVVDSSGNMAETKIFIEKKQVNPVPAELSADVEHTELNNVILSTPSMAVYPLDGYVYGYGWTPNTEVTLEINGTTWTETSYDWGDVYFYPSQFDLATGQTLVMSDGSYTKTHTIYLSITGIDEVNDELSGTAKADLELTVYAYDGTNYLELKPTVNATTGIWEANFHGYVDIKSGAGGEAWQYDTEGNSTHISWHIPDPYMAVYPQDEYVYGYDWTPNTEVTLTIGSDEWTATSNSDGSVYFYLSPFDIATGQTLMMSDGVYTRTHKIYLSITEIDQTDDVVTGKAKAGDELTVYASDGTNYNYLYPTADATTGIWEADFHGYVDIKSGAGGEAWQYDTEGNSTHISWHIPDPYMEVYPLGDYVYGYDWTPNAEVTLKIGTNQWTATSYYYGTVEFYLSDFDITPAQTLVMSDGEYSRTHIVKTFEITEIDQNNDILRGTAETGSDLYVYADDGENYEWVYLTANNFGNWTADFSGSVDIKPGMGGWIYQYDDEGNSTQVPWHIQNPYFYVYHQHNEVYGNDWSPNSTITLTIGEQSWTTQSDSGGWFYMYLSPFDIIPGQIIQVSDGIDSRTHTVKNLGITAVDISTDILTGTSDPGELRVRACGDEGCYSLYPSASTEGVWTIDFTGTTDITLDSDGYLYQYDEAGNYTLFYWFIPNPYIYVYHLTNTIYGDEWSPNSTITITIGGQSWTAQSDSDGWFRLSPTEFDILPGQSIKVTDGHSTRTHVVRNLAVTSIDIDNDVLTGTADPGELRVTACNSIEGCYSLYPEANTKGIWTEDFSGTTDITQDSYGYLYQYDEEGNYTQIYWYQPDPMVTAYLTDNSIYGDGWPALADVSLSVAGTSFGTKTSDSYGEFHFYLGGFDLDVGQEIVITSPEYSTVTYTTQNIAFEGYDITEDTVWGTAEDGVVSVRACVEDGNSYNCYSEENTVTNGDWLVDFTGIVDFVPGVDGSAGINDEIGNSTVVDWFIPDPHFSVFLPDNQVSGSRWPIGSTIKASISGVAGTFQSVTNEYGNWWLSTGSVAILPGMTVTVTGTTPDGASTTKREHLVRDIKVTNVDLRSNTVQGIAEPKVSLDVVLIDVDHYYGYWKNVFSDLNGYWKVDFSDSIDIILGCSVQVTQEDDDGDATVVYEAIDTLSIYLPLIRR